MRKLEKDSNPPSQLDLDDPESLASKELKKLEAYFNSLTNTSNKPKFNVYRNSEVKKLLEYETNGKCAYCECEVSAGSDGDVEHYRPKGNVAEEVDSTPPHPGYWWLGMDWNNLVLSCQHCNQVRKQVLFKPGMTDAEILELIRNDLRESVGKLDSFPVETGTRAFNEVGISNEKPLLIHPANDNPSDHLEWSFEEDLPMPIPKNNSGIGKASIIGYALYRSKLCKSRKKVLLQLKVLRNRILENIAALETEDDDFERGKLRGKIESSLDALFDRSNKGEPYSAMANAYFDIVLDEVNSLMLRA